MTKLFPPSLAAFAFVTARCATAHRREALLATIAFFAVRIFHISLSMTVARGTFYSPYDDAGQMLSHVVFLASFSLLLALCDVTEPRRSPVDVTTV